jgi:hypothetical protein
MKYFNPLENAKVLELIAAGNYNGGQNGAAIDLQEYDGRVAVVMQANNPAGGTVDTLDVKVQESETEDFAAPVDIADAAFTQVTDAAEQGVQIIHVDTQAVERYIRVVSAHGTGTTAAYGVVGIVVLRENLDNDDASK